MIDLKFKRMSITSPRQLQEAIDLAIAGNKSILPDIGKYIACNYYGCMHIKEGSADDLENEKIYTAFKENQSQLYQQVEGWVTYNYQKWDWDD